MGFKSASIDAAKRKGQKHNRKKDKKKEKRKVSAKICSGATVRVSLKEDVETRWAMYHNYPADIEKAAGICYYSDHPGLLTKGDIKRHNCIEKGCRTFKPLLNHATWQKPKPDTEDIAEGVAQIATLQLDPNIEKTPETIMPVETKPLMLKAVKEPDVKGSLNDIKEPQATADVSDNIDIKEAKTPSQELTDKMYENVYQSVLSALTDYFKEQEKEKKAALKKERRAQNEENRRKKLAKKEAKEREEREDQLKKAVLGNKELYPGKNVGGRKTKYTQKKINERAYTYKQGGAIINKKATTRKKNDRLKKRTKEKLDYEYKDFLNGDE